MKILKSQQGVSVLAVIIAVVIVALIGAGIYLIASKAGQDKSKNREPRASADQQDLAGEGKIRDLMALGRDLTCTFSRTDSAGDVSGRVYVSADQMRGDFKLQSEATGEIESHMIRTEGLLYVWTGNQGTKFTETDSDDRDSFENSSSLDLDEDIEYDCERWNADGSKFNVPNEVTFTDISAMVDGSITSEITADSETTVETDCSVCDQVPAGTAKDQCLAALGC